MMNTSLDVQKNIAIRYWKFVLGPGLETPGVLPVGSMYAIYI